MNKQKLMKVTYYDEKNSIRLTGYADTVVWDEKGKATLAALRFGGYPEEVRGLADAIYGGITIEIESEDGAMTLSTLAKQYRRVLSYDGVYAEATLIAEDDGQTAKNGEKKRRMTQTRRWQSLRPSWICRRAIPTSSARPATRRICSGQSIRKPQFL